MTRSGVLLSLRFDERRLNDDYIPTGFRGYGVEHRSVKAMNSV